MDRSDGFEIEQNLPGSTLRLLNSCDVPGLDTSYMHYLRGFSHE